MDEARGQRLGWYTDEQEADEISAEISWRLGVSPAATVDAYKKLMSGGSCPDTSAAPENFVPLGDYVDDHHATCFRIFNVKREQAVHKNVFDSQKLPQRATVNDGLSWDDLALALNSTLAENKKNAKDDKKKNDDDDSSPVLAVTDQAVFASSSKGLFISYDGGSTFRRKGAADGLGADEILFVAADGHDVYVSSAAGLAISRDDGHHFSLLSAGNGFPLMDDIDRSRWTPKLFVRLGGSWWGYVHAG